MPAELYLGAKFLTRNIVLSVLDLNAVGNAVLCYDTVEIMVGLLPSLAIPGFRVVGFRSKPIAAESSIAHKLAMPSNGMGEFWIKDTIEKIKHSLEFTLHVAVLAVRVEVNFLLLLALERNGNSLDLVGIASL